MDIFLIILGSIFLLIGLVGCIVPMLPGPPIAYVGVLLLHFTERVEFSVSQLGIWLLLVVVVQVIDYFIPTLGTKKMGGTKWGMWGCFIGTLAGIFIFPPWGIFIGPLAGAIIGELLGGKQTHQAIKAGMGAFVGFMLGIILKFSLCGWFIFVFIREVI